MDNPDNSLIEGDNNVIKNSNKNASTRVTSIKGSIYKNHTHRTNNSWTNTYQDNNLKIFHQNIRGLASKIDELLIALSSYSPHVICLTEHHLRIEEISSACLDQYVLGAHFCRKTYKQGGVAICVPKNIHCTSLNFDQYVSEKGVDICALKLQTLSNSFVVLCI